MLATGKAQELDVVELTEDLPEYGLKRGERGTVVTVFDQPEEAYDLEFVDEQGQSSFAYSVKPNQISSGDDVAESMFACGLALLEKGNVEEAEQTLREAIRLRPHFVAAFHNEAIDGLARSRSWQTLIEVLRLVIRLNPDYSEDGHDLADYARDNLANAYNNLGVEFARKEGSPRALSWFDLALAIGPSKDVAALIRRNISREYTSMGIRAHQRGDYEASLLWMLRACEIESSEPARHNVGVALLHMSLRFSQNGQFADARDSFHRAIDSGLFNSRPEIAQDWKSVFETLDESFLGLKAEAEFVAAAPLEEQTFSLAA